MVELPKALVMLYKRLTNRNLGVKHPSSGVRRCLREAIIRRVARGDFLETGRNIAGINLPKTS
jgi:hypothetical protein